jgi:FkbM family methyltransferase
MTTEQFYSQYGEDKILNAIFSGKRDGVCVEVGGFDGVTGSNSYFFEKLGWKCLVVEPMPDFCAAIRKARTCGLAEVAVSDKEGEAAFYVPEGSETLATMETDPGHFARIAEGGSKVREIKVKTRKLDAVLTERGIDRMDFISIDVEGHEMSVLKGFSVDKFRPRIILLEDNFNGANREVPRYLARYGYARFKRTGCNDWYGRRADHALFTNKDVLKTELQVLGILIYASFKRLVKTLLPKSILVRLKR